MVGQRRIEGEKVPPFPSNSARFIPQIAQPLLHPSRPYTIEQVRHFRFLTQRAINAGVRPRTDCDGRTHYAAQISLLRN